MILKDILDKLLTSIYCENIIRLRLLTVDDEGEINNREIFRKPGREIAASERNKYKYFPIAYLFHDVERVYRYGGKHYESVMYVVIYDPSCDWSKHFGKIGF